MAKNRRISEEDVLRESRISLLLEDYNDIFSDFDPRPYSVRALSDDFLNEARNASLDKGDSLELKLMLPKELRVPKDETTIRKRLHDHFKKHYNILKRSKTSMINKGIVSTAIGIFLMMFAAFVLFSYGEKTLFITFLIVLCEPAGWFLFWEGLDQVLFESKKMHPQFDFYHKMSKADINFGSY